MTKFTIGEWLSSLYQNGWRCSKMTDWNQKMADDIAKWLGKAKNGWVVWDRDWSARSGPCERSRGSVGRVIASIGWPIAWSRWWILFVCVCIYILYIYEKLSGQYVGLIGDESLICRGLNSNPERFDSFTFIPCFMWRIVFACLVVCRWQVRYGGQRRGSW
jgi:hypothetical protein